MLETRLTTTRDHEMNTTKLMICTLALTLAGPLLAKELLTGMVDTGGGAELTFSLSGEDRQNVAGGDIKLGERVFKIARVSRLGLIGAARLVVTPGAPTQHYGEFVAFSSSFSAQTATGQPWVAARHYVNCDRAYNSFIALYKVIGEEALGALGPLPYPALTGDVEASPESTVYCFMSNPFSDS